MVLVFRLSPHEFSFAIGPRGCCGGEWWFDVGIERGKLWSLGFHTRLHAWLRIGHWVNLSGVWRTPRPRQPLDVGWGLEVPEVLREAMRQSIIRELALPSLFAQFLPKPPVVSWVVVHGEVVKVVEQAPPEMETRGDRIMRVRPLFMGPGPGSPERPMSDQHIDGCMEAARETTWPEAMRIGTINAEQIALGRIDAGGLLGVAEPPLSFCADCPGRFRPQDLFIGKKSGTPLCEGCLDRRVARGAAKKPGEF